jgi:hypothetical protein
MEGYTTVSGSNLTDASGNKITNATISFQPCDTNGVPLSFQVNSSGQSIKNPITSQVTNGTFSVQLADTALTHPQNICYKVTVTDNSSGANLLGAGYLIQPSGPTWSFDSFIPTLPNLPTMQVGPQGPPLTIKGPYSATATYNVGDVVTFQSGASTACYSSLIGSNTGNQPDISPTAWNLLAGVPFPAGAVVSGPNLTLQSGVLRDNEVHDLPVNNSLGAVRAITDQYGKVIIAWKADGTIISTWLTKQLNSILPAGATVSGGSLVLGGVLRDSEVRDLPIPNNLGLVRAITDTGGKLMFGLAADGTIIAGGATLTRALRDLEVHDLPIPNNLGLVRAITDAGSNLIFGWKADGSVVSSGFMKQLASVIGNNPVVFNKQSRVEVSEFGAYYTAPDSNGKTQIWRADVLQGTTTQLTFSGNNTQPCPSEDGSFLVFLSDRSGSLQPYRMDRWGTNQVPFSTDPVTAYALNQICVIGQSLSVGLAPGRSNNPSSGWITTSQPFANLQFNGGVTCDETSGAVVSNSNMASFIPLTGQPLPDNTQTGTNNLGETIANGVADFAANDLLNRGIAHRALVTISGVPGWNYSQMMKGTTTYANILAEVTQAKSLATAAGWSHCVRAMCVLHGEADENLSNANYWQNLLTWQANYEADIQAITGQFNPVPFLLLQLSSFTVAYHNKTQGIIPMQQIRAWKTNPSRIIPCTASYFIPHTQDTGEHLFPDGYRLVGQYMARVYSALLRGKQWWPLYPKWNRIAKIGKQVVIPFYVPEPPLVFDTTTLSQPSFVSGSMYGFEVYDSNNNPITISSAQIVGKEQDTVVLNLATDPGNGASVAYAFTAPVGTFAGPNGPRGNLRDSSQDYSYYPFFVDRMAGVNGAPHANYPGYPAADGNPVPMWNWCLHFKEPIPSF